MLAYKSRLEVKTNNYVKHVKTQDGLKITNTQIEHLHFNKELSWVLLPHGTQSSFDQDSDNSFV